MTYLSMWSELKGLVPNLPVPHAKHLINRAWADVRRQNLWSFQLYESNWITPVAVTTGLASVTRASNEVVFNSAAGTAIDAITSPSNLSQRQLRISSNGPLYGILAWSSATLTMTLDRPYGEETDSSTTYSIIQAYYAPPYQDHLTFLAVRDMTYFRSLNLGLTRTMLDQTDVQRSISFMPSAVVFYAIDSDPNSPTYRYPLYEVWSAPTTATTLQLYGIRKGTELSAPTDTIPPQIGEDCLIQLAKYYAYEWAEANRASDLSRTQPDYKFLMGGALAEHRRLLKDYRRQDRELVNNYFSFKRDLRLGPAWAHYNTNASRAFPGTPSWW